MGRRVDANLKTSVLHAWDAEVRGTRFVLTWGHHLWTRMQISCRRGTLWAWRDAVWKSKKVVGLESARAQGSGRGVGLVVGEGGHRGKRCFGWWKVWVDTKVARETMGRNFLVERLLRVLTVRFKRWCRHARGVAASSRYAEIRRLEPRFWVF